MVLLRAVWSSIEDIPQDLRSRAVEKSGEWTLSDVGDYGLEKAGEIKNHLVAERAARKKQHDMLRQFGWTLSEDGQRWTQEGMNPEQAREAFDKVRSGQLKSNDELDRYKRSIEEKLQGERSKMEQGIAKLKERLRQAMVVDPIRNALKEHGGSTQLLAPVVERAARVEFDDEYNVSISLLNERGQPLLTKKAGSTDPMGFDEYVQDLRKHPDYRAAFAGMGAGGSGISSQSGGSARVPKGGGDVTAMSPRELLDRANQFSTQVR